MRYAILVLILGVAFSVCLNSGVHAQQREKEVWKFNRAIICYTADDVKDIIDAAIEGARQRKSVIRGKIHAKTCVMMLNFEVSIAREDTVYSAQKHNRLYRTVRIDARRCEDCPVIDAYLFLPTNIYSPNGRKVYTV